MSAPGFSTYIPVKAGIFKASFTTLVIVPAATPYLPALNAGPAMKSCGSKPFTIDKTSSLALSIFSLK